MFYINPKRKMYLALSDAEIMCNSQADMRAIYDKVVESPCSAVHNPQQYDESLKTYLPDNVVKQNMGYETDDHQSLPDLFDDNAVLESPPKPSRATRKRTLVTPQVLDTSWTNKKRQY